MVVSPSIYSLPVRSTVSMILAHQSRTSLSSGREITGTAITLPILLPSRSFSIILSGAEPLSLLEQFALQVEQSCVHSLIFSSRDVAFCVFVTFFPRGIRVNKAKKATRSPFICYLFNSFIYFMLISAHSNGVFPVVGRSCSTIYHSTPHFSAVSIIGTKSISPWPTGRKPNSPFSRL